MTKRIDKDNLYTVKVEPYLDLVRMWTRDGVSVQNIGKALGMSGNTLTEMARVHAPLFDALRVTKEMVDLSLIDSMYKRATGYTTVTHQREYVYRYNADGSLRDRRLAKEKEIEQHVPGDPRLLEYWLSHRIPEEWGPRESEIASENAGVVLLPARADDPSSAVADGAPVATAPVADADGAVTDDDTGGPGGVPGQNGRDRLRGAPILHISPQNPDTETPETTLPEKIKTAK